MLLPCMLWGVYDRVKKIESIAMLSLALSLSCYKRNLHKSFEVLRIQYSGLSTKRPAILPSNFWPHNGCGHMREVTIVIANAYKLWP